MGAASASTICDASFRKKKSRGFPKVGSSCPRSTKPNPAEHLPLVYSIAAKIARKVTFNVEMDDLVSSGCLGLVQACRKFNPSNGCQFNTFAYHRIRGAILDHLRDEDLPSRSVRKREKAGSAISSLIQAEEEPILCPFEEAHRNQLNRILAPAILQLPHRERVVISLYYYEDMTLLEIATLLRVTITRAWQIHKMALKRMERVAKRHELS